MQGLRSAYSKMICKRRQILKFGADTKFFRVVWMKANCAKRLGNKKDEIQMYINIKWCTGGKNNFNSIYKTTGSELSVTIWNAGVVTDCAMKMSFQWSVAIEKINHK